jgi:acetyltransferase
VSISSDRSAVEKVLKSRKQGPGFLNSSEISLILQAYNLPDVPLHLAQSSEEAVKTALGIGFPIAMKIASPDITHKSDVGGVLLNLKDSEAISSGYQRIISDAQKAFPEASIEGVYIQPMISAGQEVILGAIQDAQFGPMVMFGMGGVEVEGLKDVAFALAPLTGHDAEWMLENTWAGRRLRGFRSLPPADRQAVLDAIKRLGQLAADFPQLTEIEINPLRVFSDGHGVAALDVRIKLA